MTHRHVFFADDPGPAATAEWTCACGLVAAWSGGDLDGGLVVLSWPAPDEFAAVATHEDELLTAVAGVAVESAVGGRRSA